MIELAVEMEGSQLKMPIERAYQGMVIVISRNDATIAHSTPAGSARDLDTK